MRTYFAYRYLRSDPYGARSPEDSERVDRALGLIAGRPTARILDIGCGEGYGSRRLARFAEQVDAIDISDTAIRRARRLHADCPNIVFQRADLLTAALAPAGYDLVYCSEVLYYLELEQLEPARRKILDALRPHGLLLLVHHRSAHDDTSGSMDKRFGAKTVHDLFLQAPQLQLQEDVLESRYRITLYRRLSAPAAAAVAAPVAGGRLAGDDL